MGHLTVTIRSMKYPESQEDCYLIEDLRLVFESGSFTSILAPSGAGKTTLLRIACGLERRFRGEVFLDGEPLVGPGLKVQMVFQDYRLLPWKTVADNLLFALSAYRPRAGDGRYIVKDWLQRVHLLDKSDSWPKTLSGGEQARLALARALISSPNVVLLDEPFRNLDLSVKRELQRLFESELVARGTTAVMVSHNPEEATLLSDRILMFGSRPMTSPEEVQVTFDRPRNLADPAMRSLVTKLTDQLITSERGKDGCGAE